jgi:uncharacterized protein YkuJ
MHYACMALEKLENNDILDEGYYNCYDLEPVKVLEECYEQTQKDFKLEVKKKKKKMTFTSAHFFAAEFLGSQWSVYSLYCHLTRG